MFYCKVFKNFGAAFFRITNGRVLRAPMDVIGPYWDLSDISVLYIYIKDKSFFFCNADANANVDAIAEMLVLWFRNYL